MRYLVVDSPVGELTLGADEAALRRVHFGRADVVETAGHPLLMRAADQLREYFAGERTRFDLPAEPAGGSAFERAVWAAMLTIPYGHMRTYGWIAARTGDPTAARAVGVACNRNPLAIVQPCHRVVGAGGRLVGFGGGLDRKRDLLALEARVRVEREFGG
jgi:methylated-DNA-[protein]-cysteine S-methyltransferase